MDVQGNLEDGERLALLIHTERDSDYLHVTASVVMLTAENNVRNPGDHPAYRLRATCQGEHVHRSSGVYGWRTDYREVYSVDLERAEGMVATLRKLARSLARANEKDGAPRTYGQYVMRVARALGCQAMLWQQGPSRGWSYDQQPHHIASLTDGMDHIDWIVRTWQASEDQALAS